MQLASIWLLQMVPFYTGYTMRNEINVFPHAEIYLHISAALKSLLANGYFLTHLRIKRRLEICCEVTETQSNNQPPPQKKKKKKKKNSTTEQTLCNSTK